MALNRFVQFGVRHCLLGLRSTADAGGDRTSLFGLEFLQNIAGDENIAGFFFRKLRPIILNTKLEKNHD